MSRTSGRVPVAAASAVVLSAVVVLAVSPLLPGSLVADLWHALRAPTTQVVSWPDAAPVVRAVAVPMRPLPSPEPLPMLEVNWDNEVSVEMPTFPEWTPSETADANLEGIVAVQLGTPNVFANARCRVHGWENEGVCWSIVDAVFPVVQGRRVALVTAVGFGVYRGSQFANHGDEAHLGLFALSPRGTDGWTIDAARTDIATGQWGQPGSSLAGVLGPATAGWVVEDFGSAQGNEYRDLTAYAVEGNIIRRVLRTPVGALEPDAREFCFGGKVEVALRLDPTAADDGFYRFTGERVDRYWTDNEWTDDDGHVARRVPVELRYQGEKASYASLTIDYAGQPRITVKRRQPFDCGAATWALER